MTLADGFDLVLAATVLTIAAWSILIRTSFAAFTAFVAFGLLVALVWVRLAAVDVALTEAAIGGGLTGVLLLGAAARRRRFKAATSNPPNTLQRLIAALLCTAI